MSDRISHGIYILTDRDLDAKINDAYQRGVKRGRLEAAMEAGKEPVAMNCANWKDGRCETCGAQHQYFEVDGTFKCPHFSRRR